MTWWQRFASEQPLLAALAILAFFILIAWLVYRGFRGMVRRLAEKTGTTLDNTILEAVEQPLAIFIILVGIYLALAILPLDMVWEQAARRGAYVTFVGFGIYTAVRALDALLRWYGVEVAAKTRTGLDDRLVPLLRVAIPVVAGVLGLVAAFDLAGLPLVPVKGWLAQHGGRLALITFLALVGLFAIGNVVPAMIKAAVRRGIPTQPEEELEKRAHTLASVFVTTGQVFIILIVGFMLLSEVGINISPIMAGVGVAGIAIGFGAQSLVKDFLAGLFIVLENQYRVGDVVKIADISGLVEEISLRQTVLRDMDGTVHFVPNGEIRVASNFTREWSRVNMNISVAYDTDLDRAIAVINRVGQELAKDPVWASLILKPPQVLRVEKLGDSGIEIKVLGDTKPTRQWDVAGELRKRLKKAFDEAGIEIPWPHTKVYFGNSPSPAQADALPGSTRGQHSAEGVKGPERPG